MVVVSVVQAIVVTMADLDITMVVGLLMVMVVVTVVLAIVLRGGSVEIVEVLLRGGSSVVLLKVCISKACCLHQVSRR